MKCKDGSMSCTRILNRIEDHSLECLQCFSRIDVDSSIKQKALLIRHIGNMIWGESDEGNRFFRSPVLVVVYAKGKGTGKSKRQRWSAFKIHFRFRCCPHVSIGSRQYNDIMMGFIGHWAYADAYRRPYRR